MYGNEIDDVSYVKGLSNPKNPKYGRNYHLGLCANGMV